MADKLMHITNDDTQNYPFFKSKLGIEPTNQNLIKVAKVIKQTIK